MEYLKSVIMDCEIIIKLEFLLKSMMKNLFEDHNHEINTIYSSMIYFHISIMFIFLNIQL